MGGIMIKTINKNFQLKKDDYEKMIIDEYNYYIENISARHMAASLPCCLYLIALYDTLKPQNILELGSGFTSYCLRLFKKENKLDTDIWSIDTSDMWLKKSQEYCAERGLDSANFETWDSFYNKDIKFDLTFVDIDSGPKRHTYFNPVFDKFSKKGAFVYLDDIHKPKVINPLNNIVNTRGYIKYDIEKFTKDRARFSTLVKV
jgi:predicted O-methyltransferase YrrM